MRKIIFFQNNMLNKGISTSDLDKHFINILDKHKLIWTLVPLNSKEEKEKFFASKYKYNPKFVYKNIDVDLVNSDISNQAEGLDGQPDR